MTMATAEDRPRSANQSSKLRWGDLADDDERGEDYGYFDSPPEVVTEQDENGVKRVITYKEDEQGRKVKVTTTIGIRKVGQTRLSKRAVERRSWSKFGDASQEDDRSKMTVVSTEEIVLERPRAAGSKTADDIKQMKSGDLLAQPGAVLMVCRTCGKKGDHWTAKCPYKNLAHPAEGFMDKPGTPETGTTIADVAKKTTYIPPSQRVGVERSVPEVRRRNDENSVRVTNLSEDTREPDLEDLFSTFGPVTRVYVAYDQKTGTSRGFGFVNFVHRGDAEKAIAKLNGYGYDNLILRVEWAAPRTN